MPDMGSHAPVLSAFMELTTERQIGMAIGPIPASKTHDYLERHRLPYWWAESISIADAAMLKLHEAEAA